MPDIFYLFLCILIVNKTGLCANTPIGIEDDAARRTFVELTEMPENSFINYPEYSIIPKTAFSCEGKDVWNYYADQEAGCQVFHLCKSDTLKTSFLCPGGSIFNQRHLVCDWWYNFDCEEVPEILASREDIKRIHDKDFVPVTEQILETTLKSVETYEEERKSVHILDRTRYKLF